MVRDEREHVVFHVIIHVPVEEAVNEVSVKSPAIEAMVEDIFGEASVLGVAIEGHEP